MLRKDDVVYYKVQLEKLFKMAKDYGLKIIEKNGRVGFVREIQITDIVFHKEQASVNIKDYE